MNRQFELLIEKRAAAMCVAKDLLLAAEKENRATTPEEASQIDEAYATFERCDADLARLKRRDELDARFDAGPAVESRGEFGGGLGRSVDSPETRAFDTYLRTGDATELRAMGVLTGSEGGYTAPPEFWAKVTETLKFYGGIRRRADYVSTETGNPLSWPTNDDTSNTGEIVSENAAHTEDELSFGAKTLSAYQYGSKLIRVSRQMLQDTGIDFESFLARKLGQRIGRIQASHWINGNGASQPQGLLGALSTGKTTASATAITYAELVDLVHSVDVAYREGVELEPGSGAPAEDCVWLMNDLVLAYIRKIVDSTGMPIVQENARVGAPTTILGHAVVIDNNMPSAVTTGQKTIAFGNVRAAYVIRDVRGSMELLRMTERYAEYNQVGFLGWMRSDGLVQDVSAMKLLVQA